MNEQIFKARTKRFALDIIGFVGSLPAGAVNGIIGRQLLRSGTSVGANYRSACRARSAADMIAKLRIVEEECDETMYWLELLSESKMIQAASISRHVREANEITAMVVSSIKTMQQRLSRTERQVMDMAPNRKSKIENRKS